MLTAPTEPQLPVTLLADYDQLNGGLVEGGAWDELLSHPALYRHLSAIDPNTRGAHGFDLVDALDAVFCELGVEAEDALNLEVAYGFEYVSTGVQCP